MLRRGPDRSGRLPWGDVIAAVAMVAGIGVVVAVIALSPHDHANALTGILGAAALAAGFLTIGERGELGLSASFIALVLAAAFLGPASATGVALIAEVAAAVAARSTWRTMLLGNLAPTIVPAAVAALIIHSLASQPGDDLTFYLAVALAGTVTLVLNFVMFAGLRRLVFPGAEQYGMRTLLEFLPGAGL